MVKRQHIQILDLRYQLLCGSTNKITIFQLLPVLPLMMLTMIYGSVSDARKLIWCPSPLILAFSFNLHFIHIM
ncbi:hypothetical protein CICLE_v10018383mg [Citrus x clementina]|uniref:Uncharacterized protein n=1 Tax=Citrus clementina TaxID=85681 RepID=V4UJD2_CITCL|nr:hypothetical protein CICLE_v10018383mg [Citrus x clementina]